MQVNQVMSRNVAVVSPNTSLCDAARKMREMDVGVLPVGEHDRLVGVVTDRDITIRAVAEGRDPEWTPVREAMSSGVHYCFEDQELDEAAGLMAREHVRRLLVLNREKRLVGILSLGDVAAEGDDEEATVTATRGVSKPTRQ